MESSPLTLAHSHARNALYETRKSNPVAASEEHDLAAGEFSTAAQGTVDPDALRTLQLLEKHHKRLAEILKFQHEHPAPSSPETANAPSSPPTSLPTKLDVPNAGGGLPSVASTSPDNFNQPQHLYAQNKPVQRDTPSIASNLASARGIPSHPPRGSPVSPTVSAQNAGAKMAGASTRTRHDGTSFNTVNTELKARPSLASKHRPSWAPTGTSPTDIIGQETVPPVTNERPRSGFGFSAEEPFQRFYSSFEGLISKLSGPLAFASLPLGFDPSNQKSAANTKLDRNPASANISSRSADEPDVSKLVSGAALRAIRDRDGSNGSPNGHSNPAESFYVVPTAGGTISYAGILSRAEKEARRNSIDDNQDEDFVDAHESPELSPIGVPESSRTRAGRNRGTGSEYRTARGGTDHKITKNMEELQMENQALKHLADTLSKRLHMWEVNAQSSSLALQQSLKAMHHQSTASSGRQLSPVSSAVPQVPPLPVMQLQPLAGAPPPQEGAVSGASQPNRTELDARLAELEELVRRGEKELQRVGRENEKLRDVVGRYRDRWEKLKEGARVRREGNGSGKRAEAGQGIAATPTPATTAVENVDKAGGRTGEGAGATGIGGGEGEADDENAKGLLDE
ncbi:hypothetical protein AJ79_04392 [Helicocarpus griseus UAMH5409]|uniref:Uncharacterized protein n=1 Tax=Helicocarpus griseus UAMH5409 TaxID=1447875 RepID=A0A2B7XU96_9EURO|nr:hypothetical protein AJ79_04392 [Helicocarpus griseus UAMH5409]